MQKRLWLWLLGFATLIALGLLAFEFLPNYLDGIRLSSDSVDPRVQNGWAYDKAQLPIDSDTVLVVPDDARIERVAGQEHVEIYRERVCTSAVIPANQ